MKPRLHRVIISVVLFLCIAALFAGSSSCTAKAAKKAPKPKTSEKATDKKAKFKVIAYYFHGTFRCATCKKLEALSDEAIKTGFPNELKNGILEWRVVNVEGKGNEHFIQDYKLYSKALVLVEMSGDKQVKWKNLEKIWDLVNDRDAFIKYVQDETKTYLSEAPKKPAKKKESK